MGQSGNVTAVWKSSSGRVVSHLVGAFDFSIWSNSQFLRVLLSDLFRQSGVIAFSSMESSALLRSTVASQAVSEFLPFASRFGVFQDDYNMYSLVIWSQTIYLAVHGVLVLSRGEAAGSGQLCLLSLSGRRPICPFFPQDSILFDD